MIFSFKKHSKRQGINLVTFNEVHTCCSLSQQSRKSKNYKKLKNQKKLTWYDKRKVKTELCKNFQKSGTCQYSSKCKFAHGEDQLRKKIHLHKNHHTTPCSPYHYKGFCTYGKRCQFIHDQLKKNEETQQFDINQRTYFFDTYQKMGKKEQAKFLKQKSFVFQLQKLNEKLEKCLVHDNSSLLQQSFQNREKLIPGTQQKRLDVFIHLTKKVNFSQLNLFNSELQINNDQQYYYQQTQDNAIGIY